MERRTALPRPHSLRCLRRLDLIALPQFEILKKGPDSMSCAYIRLLKSRVSNRTMHLVNIIKCAEHSEGKLLLLGIINMVHKTLKLILKC